MLKKIKTEDPQEDRAEIDALKHTDWVRSRDCVCLSVSLCVYMRICVCTVWSFIGFMGCVCVRYMSVCVFQTRLWVQLMKELRQGVKLKKVQDQEFDPLPTEFSLTPFEMLMQDIRIRKFQLRKVMVSWVLVLIDS